MDFIDDNEMPEEFTGVRINPRDCVGHLLLIWVIDYLPHKPTQYTRPDKPVSSHAAQEAVAIDQGG